MSRSFCETWEYHNARATRVITRMAVSVPLRRRDQPSGSLIDENVEFYHDKAGNTFGRAALVEAIKNNICGKVTRELLPGTLQVYPMKGYGALEIGVHRFHHPGQSNDSLGEASFIHLWQYKDGAWKVTRVISYDHHEAK